MENHQLRPRGGKVRKEEGERAKEITFSFFEMKKTMEKRAFEQEGKQKRGIH